MPCVMIRDENGPMFICGPGVGKDDGIQPCIVCGTVATAICDYPVGRRKTCDQPLCAKHAIKQGAQWQDLHFCPTHVLIAEGWTRKGG